MSAAEKKLKKSGIEEAAMINEIIKRDNRYYSINKVFHLNLKKLKILPMKPNYIKKEHLDLEKRAKDIPDNIREKINNDLFKIPSEKYPWPMTESQEFGWDKAFGLNTNLRRSKVGCDVTRYADEYYKLKGRSPFATKDLSKSAEQKQ